MTTWNGEWIPTVPLTRSRHEHCSVHGLALLSIGGRRIHCMVMHDRREQTFARSMSGQQWFQLVKS